MMSCSPHRARAQEQMRCWFIHHWRSPMSSALGACSATSSRVGSGNSAQYCTPLPDSHWILILSKIWTGSDNMKWKIKLATCPTWYGMCNNEGLWRVLKGRRFSLFESRHGKRFLRVLQKTFEENYLQ